MNDLVRLTLEEAYEASFDALAKQGFSSAHAEAIANIVTDAERDDAKSHGLFRIPDYVRGIRSGHVSGSAEPVLEQLAPAVLRIDAGRAYAPLSIARGAEPLARLAGERGVAALAIVDCFHAAALWPEVERLTALDRVAFAFVSSLPYVAPAGGIRALYGTNPMAFGWPRPDRPPLVWDQASSTSARGEIQIHQRDGKTIPLGWGIDRDGDPTTDPGAVLDGGAQLPFGGYKGAAIALMVELLTGGLCRDAFGFETLGTDKDADGSGGGAELLIAIDPARCIVDGDRAKQAAHAEALFERVLSQPGTRLPAARRHAARERTPVEGITIPRSLFEDIESFRAD